MTDLERAREVVGDWPSKGGSLLQRIAIGLDAARREGAEAERAKLGEEHRAECQLFFDDGRSVGAAEAFGDRLREIDTAYARGAEEMRARAAQQAENLWFDARDTEWDEGVNCAKRRVARAIRALPLTPEDPP